MEKEGKELKKQASTSYWLEGLLGFGASTLLYIIVKVAKKEKPTVKGAVASGMAGGIGTPLTVWGVPKLIEVERQAQEKYTLSGVPPSSYPQVPVSTTPVEEKSPQMTKPTPPAYAADPPVEKPVSSVPVAPTTHKADQTQHNQCTWFDVLPQGSVILIIGRPGSGKSALAYFLLEKLQHRVSCYVVNLPKAVHYLLPPWLGVVPSLEKAPFNAALLLDETALQFPARMSTSQKNQRLLEIISLARQRRQTLIFISQEASYVDINILRGLSTLIIKEPAPLQVVVERPELKRFIQRAQRKFQSTKDDKRRWAYIAFSPCGYAGMVHTAKPSFFSDALSRCYAQPHEETEEREAPTLSKEEKKTKAYDWHVKEHLSVREIARRLGVSKSTIWNWIQEEKNKRNQTAEFLDRILTMSGQTQRK